MDEPRESLVKAWLTKSQHDLATARKLASGPDPYLDTAIYHCQQAAEKAIKGFLVFHDQRFEKIHNLQILVTQALRFARGLGAAMEAAERLTPYATIFRYPGELVEPEREEFDQALAAAEGFWSYCRMQFSLEVRLASSPGSSLVCREAEQAGIGEPPTQWLVREQPRQQIERRFA